MVIASGIAAAIPKAVIAVEQVPEADNDELVYAVSGDKISAGEDGDLSMSDEEDLGDNEEQVKARLVSEVCPHYRYIYLH
jgi:hypothetical protein